LNELKDLLQKNPLEMTDEELREHIQKIQNIRRIPSLKRIVHGSRKSTKKQKVSALEAALIAAAKKKELEKGGKE
jgi:hypothetical protein